jgi:hypothetical protein
MITPLQTAQVNHGDLRLREDECQDEGVERATAAAGIHGKLPIVFMFNESCLSTLFVIFQPVSAGINEGLPVCKTGSPTMPR